MSALPVSLPAGLAHAVWRANQIGVYSSAAVSSGYPLLDAVLPQGGWPSASLTELLLQQAGIGELGLLQPALAVIARHRPVVLVQPPYLPQIATWQSWGLAPQQLLWIRTRQTADALWSAEQILRNGSCGALLLWQSQVRSDALRRLHLAAQAADTVFWLLRPLAAAQDASPAPLRLALRPMLSGIRLEVLKRRGPQLEQHLQLQLDPALHPALHRGLFASPSPVSSQFSSQANQSLHHATLDRRAFAAAGAGSVSPALV